MLNSLRKVSGKIIRIIEVSPRDGLQNMSPISFSKRLQLLNLLNECNFDHIEVGAMVKIKALENSDKLYQKIKKKNNTEYSLLALNEFGFLKTKNLKPSFLSLGISPSEKFCQANVNKSINEIYKETEKMLKYSNSKGIKTRGYISTAFYCPFQGKIDPKAVVDQALFLKEQGCYEISLGDTTGESTHIETRELLNEVLKYLPAEIIAGHYHDTHNMALTNVAVSLDMGITAFDSSVYGLGGCPYAPGSSGNIATEKLINFINGLNLKNNININELEKVLKFVKNNFN